MKTMSRPKRTVLMFFLSVVFFLAALIATQHLCFGFPVMTLGLNLLSPIEFRRGFLYFFPYALLLSVFYCLEFRVNFKDGRKLVAIFVTVSILSRYVLDKIYVHIIQLDSLNEFLTLYYVKHIFDIMFVFFQFYLLFIVLGKRKAYIKRKKTFNWAVLFLIVGAIFAIVLYISSAVYLNMLFYDGQEVVRLSPNQLESIEAGMQLSILKCGNETLFIISVCLFWLFERLTVNENDIEDVLCKN